MAGKDLAVRMKEYEDVSRFYLTRRLPMIIRIDGKAFHTYTRGCEKPFDFNLIGAMIETATFLCGEIQGARLGYVQSDEISIFCQTYDNLGTEPWLGGCIQKIVSVAASLATSFFNKIAPVDNRTANFDARVFVLPHSEVTNYFIWRQQDWTRNSIEMLARAHFSHKQLHCVNNKQMQEMLFTQKGVNWSDLPNHLKNGVAVIEQEDGTWASDPLTPIFSQNRDYIETLVAPREDHETILPDMCN